MVSGLTSLPFSAQEMILQRLIISFIMQVLSRHFWSPLVRAIVTKHWQMYRTLKWKNNPRFIGLNTWHLLRIQIENLSIEKQMVSYKHYHHCKACLLNKLELYFLWNATDPLQVHIQIAKAFKINITSKIIAPYSLHL